MDSETKESLLERFRAYLDQRPDGIPVAPGEDARPTDLYSLFTELVALKAEVRLESRQVKTALDEFRAVFETLQTSQGQLGSELERARNTVPEHRRATLKPVLLELVELHDRMEAGLRALQNYRPTLWGRLCRREQALRQAVAQGQDLSLRRLEQIHAEIPRSGVARGKIE